jgi:hypothetical protein
LHNQFLAMQARRWRTGDLRAGQCFVVGFPADLARCSVPFDDGCRGSDATIVQDGPMTFYNSDPILSPVNYDSMDWCNDDETQSQSHEHTYTYTETQSFETTVSFTVKTTVGMESKTTFSESLIFESGSEEIDMSFSVEMDVTKSSTQTTTKEKQWSSKNTVRVGPRSHVYSTCWLSMATLESPFDARVRIHSPVVWACTSTEEGPNDWVYPDSPSLWQSFTLETFMEKSYGFSKDDLDATFSAKFGGTWKGIVGQRVQCNTHTVQLKPGEECHIRASAAEENVTILL